MTLFFGGVSLGVLFEGIQLGKIWRDKKAWEIRHELFIGDWPETFEEHFMARFDGPKILLVLALPLIGAVITGGVMNANLGCIMFVVWVATIWAGWLLERRVLSKFTKDSLK